MQSFQKNMKDRKERKRNDKFEKGKSIAEFIDPKTMVSGPSNSYRDNWESIFGKKTGDEVSGEGSGVLEGATQDGLDEGSTSQSLWGSRFDNLLQRIPGLSRAKKSQDREGQEATEI